MDSFFYFASPTVCGAYFCGFTASRPDSFQPACSHSHEGGSAAALLSLPCSLHSLPSRACARTHSGSTNNVRVSRNPKSTDFHVFRVFPGCITLRTQKVSQRRESLRHRQAVHVGEEFVGDTSVGSWSGLRGWLLPWGTVVRLLHGETLWAIVRGQSVWWLDQSAYIMCVPLLPRATVWPVRAKSFDSMPL